MMQEQERSTWRTVQVWLYWPMPVVFMLLIVYVFPAVLGSAPRPSMQGWPTALRISACLGIVGGFAILCHPLLRWWLVPGLLTAVALRSAALFGAGTPTQLLVAAPFLVYVLWKNREMRRKRAST